MRTREKEKERESYILTHKHTRARIMCASIVPNILYNIYIYIRIYNEGVERVTVFSPLEKKKITLIVNMSMEIYM